MGLINNGLNSSGGQSASPDFTKKLVDTRVKFLEATPQEAGFNPIVKNPKYSIPFNKFIWTHNGYGYGITLVDDVKSLIRYDLTTFISENLGSVPVESVPYNDFNMENPIYNDKLVYIPMTTSGTISSLSIHLFDTTTLQWLTPIPITAKTDFTMCLVGSKLYLFSGIVAGVDSKTAEVYDLETGVKEDLPDLPAVKKYGLAIHYNNKILLFGGNSTATHLYDIALKTYETKTAVTGNMTGRSPSVVITSSNIMYYFNSGTTGKYSTYNIDTAVWTSKSFANFDITPTAFNVTVVGNTLNFFCIIGSSVYNYIYDLAKTIIHSKLLYGYPNSLETTIRSGRKYKDKLYIIAGIGSSTYSDMADGQFICELDLTTNELTKYPITDEFYLKAHSTMSFVKGDKFYILFFEKLSHVNDGGNPVANTDTVFEFDLITKEIKKLPLSAQSNLFYNAKNKNLLIKDDNIFVSDGGQIFLINPNDKFKVSQITNKATTSAFDLYLDSVDGFLYGSHSSIAETNPFLIFKYDLVNKKPYYWELGLASGVKPLIGSSFIVKSGIVYFFQPNNKISTYDTNTETLTIDKIALYGEENISDAVSVSYNNRYVINKKGMDYKVVLDRVLYETTKYETVRLMRGEVLLLDENDQILSMFTVLKNNTVDIPLLPGFKLKSALGGRTVILGK